MSKLRVHSFGMSLDGYGAGPGMLPTVGREAKFIGRIGAELDVELHSQNIRCTMISPGAIARTVGEQFGRIDQKELARVYENGHPGQRDRESDRLRNRATSRGGSR